LINYLRRTKTIIVNDIEPYIWLSQDTLSLGLKSNDINLLSTGLADGNFEKVKSLLADSESEMYRNTLVQVASRIVEQRLKGIAQRNGVKVLAHLLPDFDNSLKPEIGNVIAKLIHQAFVKDFSAEEIFNVLRWAREGGIDSQKNVLMSLIIEQLDSIQLRQPIFSTILQNADVIESSNYTERVQKWLVNILNKENQSKPNLPSPNSENVIDQNKENREFAEWFLTQGIMYSENNLVIDRYFSHYAIDYMVGRLLGDYHNEDYVYMDEDGIGLNIKGIFDIVAIRIFAGVDGYNFWTGIRRILCESRNSYDTNYCLEKIQALVPMIHPDSIEEFITAIITGIYNLIDEKNKDLPEETNEIIQKALGIVFLLRRHNNQKFNNEALKCLPSQIAVILKYALLRKPLLEFIEGFSIEFGKDDSEVFILGLVEAFIGPSEEISFGTDLLDSIIRLNNFVTPLVRNKIFDKINALVMTNIQPQIDFALTYIRKITDISEYKELLGNQVNNWVGEFRPDPLSLLQKKIEIYNILINCELLKSDILIQQIITYFPFSGDQDQLRIIFDELLELKEQITLINGINLFQTIIAHMDQYGSLTTKAFKLIASWIKGADEKTRSQFHSQIIKLFSSSPKDWIDILSDSWDGLTSIQIQENIIQFYSLEITGDDLISRDSSTKKGLAVIKIIDLPTVIQHIWEKLVSQGTRAEDFMSVAVQFLPLEILLQIREQAINFITENRASPESELNFRLLSVTIRNDMRRIMPTVDLFVNFFGSGLPDVQLALKYAAPCLNPLRISRDHKSKLAEAMAKASNRIDVQEIKDEIRGKTHELGLKWWDPNYWK
jgi:hypothetical protein